MIEARFGLRRRPFAPTKNHTLSAIAVSPYPCSARRQ